MPNRKKNPKNRIESDKRVSSIGGIDWVGYYQNFRDLHGEPVEYKGRSLFPDGWMYSCTDFRGPEYPPPEDELELYRIQKDYWTVRKGMLTIEWDDLKKKFDSLMDLQSTKSASLMQYQYIQTEEGMRRESSEIDLDILYDRLDVLTQSIEYCTEEIQRYKHLIREIEHEHRNRDAKKQRHVHQ